MKNRFRLPEKLFASCYSDDPGVVRADIAPAEFLRLAKPSAGHDGFRDGFRDDLINEWQDVPYLIIDPDTAIVFGHEGRHRVSALAAAGYELVEIAVEITPDPMRFNGDLSKMLAWEWDGKLPAWAELAPEQAWLDGL